MAGMIGIDWYDSCNSLRFSEGSLLWSDAALAQLNLRVSSTGRSLCTAPKPGFKHCQHATHYYAPLPHVFLCFFALICGFICFKSMYRSLIWQVPDWSGALDGQIGHIWYSICARCAAYALRAQTADRCHAAHNLLDGSLWRPFLQQMQCDLCPIQRWFHEFYIFEHPFETPNGSNTSTFGIIFSTGYSNYNNLTTAHCRFIAGCRPWRVALTAVRVHGSKWASVRFDSSPIYSRRRFPVREPSLSFT